MQLSHVDGGPHDRRTPQGLIGTWVQAKGGRGVQIDVGNGDRLRHAARGTEASSGGWRVAGVGEVQVDNAPFREGVWVVSLNIGVTTMNGF